ncbi:mannose-6-phosphate isomerase [Hirsutella rhossiliensis]|uniref:Mannose-6-phosphate isomerase n=1 Tax=Hirsutella rhossiliensis TaxID=111463 RepID=A0A9P8MSD2_9HYPO|nr:mannose-6-phosphate isomerase [Hirsutella rhossiliensis]KAH0960172.1 mannose-6-phosphate isomerase [Hirsutella rhossiliensis]
MAPILLHANQPPDGFYAGGARISTLRGAASCASYQPEDWVASTTCCRGSEGVGLSKLPDGRLLRDAVASEPERWLGPAHVAKHGGGGDTKLLVKLLDAGQRLPVHAHPHVDWAARHLAARHGKAEAWYVLTPGSVWLGLRDGFDGAGELRRLVLDGDGDGEALLARMHKVDVVPHQSVYVPPGVLHCLGEGVMVVEVQEPEDMSVLCEWKGFRINGRKEGHLGLGFDVALTAVETRARTREQIMELVKDSQASTSSSDGSSVVVDASREYFELERRRVVAGAQQRCRRGFAVVIVLGGAVSLAVDARHDGGGDDGGLALSKGATVVVPFADGDFVLEGDGADVLIARPPQ